MATVFDPSNWEGARRDRPIGTLAEQGTQNQHTHRNFQMIRKLLFVTIPSAVKVSVLHSVH